jgi:hypothetical protein
MAAGGRCCKPAASTSSAEAGQLRLRHWRGGWSEHLRSRFAGQPLKAVAADFTDGAGGRHHHRRGECLVTATGVEGSLIYALAAPLRDTIEPHGEAVLHIDLMPDWSAERVATETCRPRGARSLASHLQSRLGLKGLKAALLRELLSPATLNDPTMLAAGIKALPLRLTATRPLDEAISSAGGVRFEAMDEHLMLRAAARRFLCRRNARLGSPHRRLPAHRLLRQRARRCMRRAGLVEKTRCSASHLLGGYTRQPLMNPAYRSRPASCQAFLTGDNRYSATVRVPSMISALVCMPAASGNFSPSISRPMVFSVTRAL